MDIPTDAWHREIIANSDLDLLEEEFSTCEESILEFTDVFCDGEPVPGQTPENLAYVIGEFAYSNHSQDDFFVEVIENKMKGEEGEKLAKAYIGIQAMKAANS